MRFHDELITMLASNSAVRATTRTRSARRFALIHSGGNTRNTGECCIDSATEPFLYHIGTIKARILHEVHDAPTSGQSGVNKTYSRVSALFIGQTSTWMCWIRVGRATSKPAGLLQPIGPMQRTARGKDAILVMTPACCLIDCAPSGSSEGRHK